jgi:hypothetical protein
MRFDSGGRIVKGDAGGIDLTPAALHHLVLRCVQPDIETTDASLNRAAG